MSAQDLNEKAIFNVASQIPAREARACYLAQVCGEDSEMRDRVALLLRIHEAEPGFLETPPRGVAATMEMPSTSEMAGTQIGPYKLREKIAEGGMGVVYVAEQTEPVQRKVALKVIRPGMAGPNVVARFEAERQALAMMNHPNIARVFDGGATDQQLPYFVMELVQGLPITDYCDQKRLTTHERLELIVDVCRAVQHAHQKGIIHRDLKPSNVLVAEIDGKAVPKVIDFGVAKALHQKLTDQTVYTQFSQMVGTPLYMSPEQAGLGVIDVDTRSDVYSLGVMLYELLTGETPLSRETFKEATFDEIRRIIREDEPRKPSVMVSTLDNQLATTISTRRKTDARSLSLSLQRELDWIVMKSLEKDRNRRYESVNAFASDIERYLHDKPVEACPPSVLYRFQKYSKRHKGLLLASALIATILMMATGISMFYAVRAEREKANAVAAHEQATDHLGAAVDSIDKLLEHVSSPAFAELPQAQTLRRDILEDVLKFYGRFRSTAVESPEVRYRAAVAWLELARLGAELDVEETADLGFQQALRLTEQLTIEYPSNIDYQTLRIDTQYKLGCYRSSNQARERDNIACECFQDVLREIAVLPRQEVVASDQLMGIKLVSLTKLAFYPGFELDTEERREYASAALALAEELHGNESDPVNYGIRLLGQFLTNSDPDRAAQFFRWTIDNSRQWSVSGSSRYLINGRIDNLQAAHMFFRNRDSNYAAKLAFEELQLCDQFVTRFPSRRWNFQRQENALANIFFLREAPGLKPETVLEELERRIRIAPEHHRTHFLRALYLSRCKDPIAALSEAIDKHPTQSAYREFRGMLQLDQMMIDEALSDFSDAFMTIPEPTRLAHQIAWHSRRLTRSGRPDDALRLAELAREFGVDTQELEMALGEAERELGRIDEATLHFDKAKELETATPLQLAL